MTASVAQYAQATELLSLLRRDVAAHDGNADDALAPLLDAALYAPLRAFLSRPGKEFRARLCARAYAIAGGEPGALPNELPFAIEVLHAGSLIVDDIEDDSDERRGAPSLHRMFGTPVALNAGNWLYFWPQRLVSRSGLGGRARLSAHERLSQCLLRCHEGQALDLTLRIDALPRSSVAAVVCGVGERKTGALMGLAAAFGAIAAGADPSQIDALERFGCQLGVGLQMLDDLSGVRNAARRDKGAEDLRNGRATWVWAWLSEELDATAYADRIAELRAACQSEQTDSGAALDALIEQLRFALGVTGLRRARVHLEQAIETLAAEVGAGPWCEQVAREVRWLERRFMEGGS